MARNPKKIGIFEAHERCFIHPFLQILHFDREECTQKRSVSFGRKYICQSPLTPPLILNKQNPFTLFFTVLAILSGWIIFYIAVRFEYRSDIPLHSILLNQHLESGSFPFPPLYYLAIYLISGFSQHADTLNNAGTLVLALAVGAKYRTTTMVLFEEAGRSKMRDQLAAAGGFIMLFSAPFFFDLDRMYLGKLATNVWHNSTTIAVMPFVVAMFYISYRVFTTNNKSPRYFIYIFILGVLSLLIKPSFLFAFIPVFAVMALRVFGWRSKTFHYALACSALLFAAVLIQYYLIYLQGPSGVRYDQEQSGITFAPFAYWKIYSENILLDSLLSVAYPLTACLLFGKNLLRQKYFQFALLLFITALALGILLFETGPRSGHGNLFWQVVMCNYLLFICTLKFHLEKIHILGVRNFRVVLLSLIFLAHVGAGMIYILKYYHTGSYH